MPSYPSQTALFRVLRDCYRCLSAHQAYNVEVSPIDSNNIEWPYLNRSGQ